MKKSQLIFFIAGHLLYSNLSFANIFGKFFSRKNINSEEREVSDKSEIDEIEGPLIRILDEWYPVNKIDIPTGRIYENHSREELISLLGQAIDLSSLAREDDSLEEAFKKYISSAITTAVLLDEFGPTLFTTANWINGKSTYDIGMKYKKTNANQASNMSTEVLFRNIPNKLIKTVSYFSSYRGRFFQRRYSTLAKNYFRTQNIDLSDAGCLLEASEKYLLSLLLKDMYSYWQEVNRQVLNQIPKVITWKYLPGWRNTHIKYLSKLDSNTNNLWLPFLREFKKYSILIEE